MARSLLVDLTKLQILSVGTGPLQLGGALPAFRGQEALLDGALYSYTIQQGANYEIGQGTYNAGASTLTRGVILSSYGNSAVPLSPNAVCTFTVLSPDLAPIPGPPGEDGNPGLPGDPGVPGSPGQNADYAIAGNAVANIQAGEILTDHIVVRACTLAAGLDGSQCSVGTPPAATFVLSVLLNGAAAGSITIATDGTVTMATVGGVPVPLAIGDVVTVEAPNSTDATIGRLRYTLKGN